MNNFFLTDQNRLQSIEKLYYELKSILKGLKYEFNGKLVKEGLVYFQECYRTRPERYPGNNIYLEIFIRGVKKGMNQEEASIFSKKIIEREMEFIDAARPFGFHYSENWFE